MYHHWEGHNSTPKRKIIKDIFSSLGTQSALSQGIREECGLHPCCPAKVKVAAVLTDLVNQSRNQEYEFPWSSPALLEGLAASVYSQQVGHTFSQHGGPRPVDTASTGVK